MSPREFKNRYPRLYNKILKLYRSHTKVFDVQAAINMYLRGDKTPACSVCHSPVTITKKFRAPVQDIRCSKHINVSVVYSLDLLRLKNPHNYQILDVSDEIITDNSLLTLRCQIHERIYKQSVKNFLNGMRCQKCYHDTFKPRTTLEEWMQLCTKTHHSKYDYSRVELTNGLDSEISIICPEHGEFQQNAGVHSRGHGCKKCSYLKPKDHTYFLSKAKQVHNDKYLYQTQYLGAREKVQIVCPTHGMFEQVAYYHLAGNGCPTCGIENSTFKSKPEYEIIEFLNANGIATIHGDYRLGFEIDIFLPEHNIGIEFNGLFWHSSNSTDQDNKFSKKHLYKTDLCEKNGYQLFHIFEPEWTNPATRQIWQSVILNACNRAFKKIPARSLTVCELKSSEAKKFFSETHLQGFCTSSKYFGLLNHDKLLVSAIAVNRARFGKSSHLEIVRFSSSLNTVVQGGFSKLLSHVRTLYPEKTIISYANRRWSLGAVYHQLGFQLTGVTSPCYYYTDCKSLWHRSSFMKHKLPNKLQEYSNEKTEAENMYANGYRRIWDSGHKRYELGALYAN